MKTLPLRLEPGADRGCIVRTTAEVLVALLPGWRFTREADSTTGFQELRVQRGQGSA